MLLYWRHKCDSLDIFVLNYDDYKGSEGYNVETQSGFPEGSPFAPGWESPKSGPPRLLGKMPVVV